jgi:hypothetical protein
MKSTSSDGDGASKNAIACTHGIVNADIQTSWHYSNEQHIINTEPLGGNKKCNDEEKFAVEQLLRKAFPETMSKAGTNRHKKPIHKRVTSSLSRHGVSIIPELCCRRMPV